MYSWSENPILHGIHASRYIASYANVSGKIYPRPFRIWLEQLNIDGEHLSEQEVEFLVDRATNGKLELEMNAERFAQTNNIHRNR